MKNLLSARAGVIAWLFLVSAATTDAGSRTKTLRVEHGRPVVVVSEKGVLLLEFLKQPVSDALVAHDEADLRHCRAKYRYRLFDGTTKSVTNGDGLVEEVFRTVSRSATGGNVEDAGSRTQIGVGEFSIWWSEASAGARSWLYYHVNSGIRFIQQPEGVPFESVDATMFERYFNSVNVREFVAVDRTVQVIGPAVFSGDLPIEKPVSARIESCGVREGAFELRLSHLARNRSYVIESSYEMKSGNWNAVHSFIAREATHSWSDPLGKDVTIAFYRIREGQ